MAPVWLEAKKVAGSAKYKQSNILHEKKKSVNKDLSFLIKIPSTKLHSAPLTFYVF